MIKSLIYFLFFLGGFAHFNSTAIAQICESMTSRLDLHSSSGESGQENRSVTSPLFEELNSALSGIEQPYRDFSKSFTPKMNEQIVKPLQFSLKAIKRKIETALFSVRAGSARLSLTQEEAENLLRRLDVLRYRKDFIPSDVRNTVTTVVTELRQNILLTLAKTEFHNHYDFKRLAAVLSSEDGPSINWRHRP